MTIPYERLRSLRWGLELLKAVAVDEKAAASVREQAVDLMSSYPTLESLITLIDRGHEALPADWADAIEAAGDLFRRLQYSGQGSEATRHLLVFTRRHFPLPGEARNMVNRIGPFGLTSWIADDRTSFLDNLGGGDS